MASRGHNTIHVPVYNCPHCHIAVVSEKVLITPQIAGRRFTPTGPEWHCHHCGETFPPDYFDAALITVAWPTYCKACFAAIAVEDLPEDTARLELLVSSWDTGEELKCRQGRCARCGKEGAVVYHEAIK